MKIKPRLISRWSRKLNDYGEKKDLFQKYAITQIKEEECLPKFIVKRSGFESNRAKVLKTIFIKGPKAEFVLKEAENGLRSFNEETKEWVQLPLFYVSPFYGSGAIQGATHFVEKGDELVAYTTKGRGFIAEL